jgi:isopentenyldiphosphate isomerase
MTSPVFLAQNPDELFDIVDAWGNPTGIVKRRADVHRDGDWHQAIHVWIIGDHPGSGPFLLFQRRGLHKDTMPGWIDCTVGGHLGAGETVLDACREIEEEIGIAVDPGMLIPVGRRIHVMERPGQLLDHEIQHVYLLRDEREMVEYVPNPHELEGLVRIPIADLLDVLVGDRDEVIATQRRITATADEPLPLRQTDFIDSTDRYFYRVAVAAQNFLRGDRHVTV